MKQSVRKKSNSISFKQQMRLPYIFYIINVGNCINSVVQCWQFDKKYRQLCKQTFTNIQISQILYLVIFRIIYRIILQKMLARGNSKSNLRNYEDQARCLDQKNSMITVLQTEVQHLKVNRQKYNMAVDHMRNSNNKYDNLIRDYESMNENYNEKLELTKKTLSQLKLQIQSQQQNLNQKNNIYKDAKFQTQLLLQHNHVKEEDLTNAKMHLHQIKNQYQVSAIQGTRIKQQICLIKEEIDKQKKQLINSKKAVDCANEKIYKSQNYIRNLRRQQNQGNQKLNQMEEDNNYVDQLIDQLQDSIENNNKKCNQVSKQCEDLQYLIATKELQKKRIEKETKEKQKQNHYEKEKQKEIKDNVTQKKNQFNRMSQHQQCNLEEINQFMKNNSEIMAINQQLKQDLDVCLKHLMNLTRHNKNLDEQILKLKEVNQNVIKRLSNPNECKIMDQAKYSRATSFGETNF